MAIDPEDVPERPPSSSGDAAEDRREGAGRVGRDADRTAQDGERADGVPFTQKVGRIVLVVVAALFVIFAIANAQFVDFSWIFGETEVTQQAGERVRGGVPLIVLLIAAFVAGAVVGGLAVRQRRRRREAHE